jgi:hypothetical protein
MFGVVSLNVSKYRAYTDLNNKGEDAMPNNLRCPVCRDTGFVWVVPGHPENGGECAWCDGPTTKEKK